MFNGRNVEEYWNYSKNSFISLSSTIYDVLSPSLCLARICTKVSGTSTFAQCERKRAPHSSLKKVIKINEHELEQSKGKSRS